MYFSWSENLRFLHFDIVFGIKVGQKKSHKIFILFTHSPQRWNHESSDGLFLLLLLHTTNFPGNSRQSSDSYLFLLLLFPLMFLSRELSTDSRQSSDLYLLTASPSISFSISVQRAVHRLLQSSDSYITSCFFSFDCYLCLSTVEYMSP